MNGRTVIRCLLAAAVLLALVALPASAQQPPAGPGHDAQQEAPIEDPCADVPLWEKPVCRAAEGVRQGAGAIITAGLTSMFDQLYEWVAGGAVWLMSELVGLIDASSRPDVTATWFIEQYRLMGNIAVLFLMPLLMVATVWGVVRQDWRGLLRAYFVYVPIAMLGTAIAIPLVDMTLGITDWASALFLDPMRGDIDAFLATVKGALEAGGPATAAAGTPGVAPFLMFVAASIIALGAFAVWVELVLRAAGIYVVLFFLPLGFIALVWPATRKWFGRLVKALVALILSKFIIVAVIALAAAVLGNMADAGMNGVVAGSALMLIAAFSPLALFAIANVAGDDMAPAIEGATQHRTSPVPVPSAQQSASKVYGRIMNARGARDGAGTATAGGTAVAGTAAASAGTAAAGAAKTAVAAGPRAGEAAGGRLDEMTASNGHKSPARPSKNGSTSAGGSSTTGSEASSARAPSVPQAEPRSGEGAPAPVPPPPYGPDATTPQPAPPAAATPPQATPDPPSSDRPQPSARPPQPSPPPPTPPSDR